MYFRLSLDLLKVKLIRFRIFCFNPLNIILIMEENEKKSPLENRLFMVEMIGKSFVVREALPNGNVIHSLGDYSSICEFFSSL